MFFLAFTVFTIECFQLLHLKLCCVSIILNTIYFVSQFLGAFSCLYFVIILYTLEISCTLDMDLLLVTQFKIFFFIKYISRSSVNLFAQTFSQASCLCFYLHVFPFFSAAAPFFFCF